MSELTTLPSNTSPHELTQEDYFRIRSQIVAVLRKAGARGEEIEDLVQETFSEAHRLRAQFEGRSEFDTWVVGIAKKLWLHYLRRQNTQKRAAEEVAIEAAEQMAEPLRAQGPSPETQTAEWETLAEVERELAKLPDILRQPLLLQVEGFSYKEITALLAVPQKLVTSRIHQARDLLRRLFPERSGARRPAQHGP